MIIARVEAWEAVPSSRISKSLELLFFRLLWTKWYTIERVCACDFILSRFDKIGENAELITSTRIKKGIYTVCIILCIIIIMWILHCTVRSSHVNLWFKTGLEFLKFPMGPFLIYALSVSVFQKEAIYFQQIVLQKRLYCYWYLILFHSLSTHHTMSQKKKAKMSNRETQGGNGRAISDNLLMYGIHIFSWIDTTGVWLEARGFRQKMLLSYRKSIKHCVSPATECFSPYSPLFSF